MNRPFVFIVLLAITFGASGCATPSRHSSDSPTMLEPQSIGKFTDLPVPMGFKPIPKESYSFESANMRVALLKYEGKSSPEKVVAFFKEQMPLYNWELLNAVEYGQRLLNFERDQESCIVTVTPKGSGSLLGVTLGPKAKSAARRLEKPLK